MKSDSNKRAADGDVDPLDELLRSAQWPDDASDPLDQLLRMAQWPEPAVDSLPHWRQQMAGWRSRPAADPVSARPKREASPARQRQRRRMAWALVGSASVAAFFMAMTLWISGLPGDKSSASLPTKVARDLAPKAPPSIGTSERRDFRPIDAMETFPAAAVFQSPEELYLRMSRARNQVWALPKDEDAIDRILAQRIAEPGGNLEDLVQPLLAERAECEQRLLERFRALDDERASAAIELLGCVGSEASVPLVLQARVNPATHAPAVRTLSKIADARMLAWLALDESDPDLRDEITAALRVRGDKQTLVFVLAVQGEYSCLVPRPD